MRLHFDQQPLILQVAQHRLTRFETVKTAVGRRCGVVQRGVERKDIDQRQLVTLGARVVVEVVCAGDFDHPRSKRRVNKVVGNDRDGALAQRQLHVLPHQVLVAGVVGVHGHSAVAQHGFGAGGGHHQAWHRFTINGLWAVGKGVAHVVQRPLGLGAFYFKVGHRALQHRVPVDQAFATVNQALLVQTHKGFGDDA